MKKIILFFIAIFILFLVIQCLFDNIDFCMDKGGCWDYYRNKCEMYDQGNCVKDRQDCVENFKGEWKEENKYCQIDK